MAHTPHREAGPPGGLSDGNFGRVPLKNLLRAGDALREDVLQPIPAAGRKHSRDDPARRPESGLRWATANGAQDNGAGKSEARGQ